VVGGAATGGLKAWGRRLFTASLSELNPLRRQEPYLAIDIGSHSIKVVEAVGFPPALRILHAARLPTPAGAIHSNMVAEPAMVAESIKALVDAQGIGARKTITAIPGPAVIVKRVIVPAQSSRDLENTILFEAGSAIPEDLENVNLDYQVIDYQDDGKQMQVMLVAAKKDIVGTYGEAIHAAGLLPVVVDVDYFALENMFELNYDVAHDRAIALVNIGARYTSINILKNAQSVFTHDVAVGGRDVNDALVRDLRVSQAVAETLQAGETVPTVAAADAAGVMDGAVAALIDEIQHAITVYWTGATDESIHAVYVTGGAARVPGLPQALCDRLGAAVEVADPFAKLTLDQAVDTPEMRRRAPEFAVAVGLATRRPEDK
jgi:type IV pilus assembly protein PilM